MKFIYIGFSAGLLEAILQEQKQEHVLGLAGVITRYGKLPESILSLLEENKIPVAFAASKQEVEDIITQYGDLLYVMHGFDIIIPDSIARRYTVINIHSGDIKTNRGKTPLSWSILEADKEIIVSLYRISGEIDCGYLFMQYRIPVLPQDNHSSLRKKINGRWHEMAIGIRDFMDNKIPGEAVYGGGYRRGVVEKDYTINLADDSEENIVQKIKSQKNTYRGAVIFHGNLKLYVTDYDIISKK